MSAGNILVIAVFLLSFSILPDFVQAQYSGGSGTEADPYQISIIADWQTLMATPADWDTNFILTADLDLNGVTLTPIGDPNEPYFAGSLNGNGHVIRNVTINMPSTDYVGLFGYVYSGRVSNLGLENANITGHYSVGGLIGYNFNGTVSDCYVTGDVNATYTAIGGLIGDNVGTVRNSYATTAVSGLAGIGGLIGVSEGVGTIVSDCHATGPVSNTNLPDTGIAWFGGLIGVVEQTTVSNCYATGNVYVYNNSGNLQIGGLIGVNVGTVNNCYATGSVGGMDYVGGLIGYNANTIGNSYSTGSVIGRYYVGGLIGNNCGSSTTIVGDCYATGAVTGSSYVGGLIGYNYNPVNACFWDINTTGQETSYGGTGKTTAEMQTKSTFTDAGWDFTNETVNGTSDIWRMCTDGIMYPRLNWQSPVGDLACPDGVNFVDFAYFADRWLESDCTSSNNFCGGADMDSSGTVDMQDLKIFADNWLEGI